MKNVLQCSILIICILFSNSNSYTIPMTCTGGGLKLLNPDIHKQPRYSLNACLPERKSPLGKSTLFKAQQERLNIIFGNSFVKPQQITPQQTNSDNIYQHQLDGDWNYVVGHVGFFYDFPDSETAFVSIIGLRTSPTGDGNYTTQEWDRKAFWFDVGDGIPMHLSAEYFVEYIDPDDESLSVIVYNCYNLLYRQKGKDYSQSEFNGEWITLELFTDFDNNFIDYNILLTDENDEVVDIRQFEEGDEVESWTSVYRLDEPDSIYLTSMEEDFRTVQSEPIFMYENMIPNVDFLNELTEGLIDFAKIDLQLSLFGVNLDDSAETAYQFSLVKNIRLKWDGTVTTSVTDWFSHWFK